MREWRVLHSPLQRIHQAFDQTLGRDYRVRLLGGFNEPYYQPASRTEFAEIQYREDFPASALHEIAHWCLAGPRRRMMVDYGYWYESDRDPSAQAAFESVEARPQALEWVFSQASGLPFRISADNLTLGAGCEFRNQVQAEVLALVSQMPKRALEFSTGLALRSGSANFLSPSHYREQPA